MQNSAHLNIVIASDHAGFDLKAIIIEFLKSLNYQVNDLGTNSAHDSVDYPDYAKKLNSLIEEAKSDFGILICGSGIGMSMAANRNKNIRAALCVNKAMAKLSRLHNDANVLCLGARLTKAKTACQIVKTFLTTEFEEQKQNADNESTDGAKSRHTRRIKKFS